MNVFILDPKYCHIYHYCAIGAHTVLQCAGNLWFSTDSQGCDWPEKSDCMIELFFEILFSFIQ
jgi:hypothetical protein